VLAAVVVEDPLATATVQEVEVQQVAVAVVRVAAAVLMLEVMTQEVDLHNTVAEAAEHQVILLPILALVDLV
jgi:hypothetical protein